MSHTISDRTRQARELEFGRDKTIAVARAQRRAAAFATRVVSIWNGRMARGLDLFFSPTIGAALAAGKPVLQFYCPGCGVRGEADLRRFDRHPAATVESLIPAISCTRCQPQPPFARLTAVRDLNEDE